MAAVILTTVRVTVFH